MDYKQLVDDHEYVSYSKTVFEALMVYKLSAREIHNAVKSWYNLPKSDKSLEAKYLRIAEDWCDVMEARLGGSKDEDIFNVLERLQKEEEEASQRAVNMGLFVIFMGGASL